MSSHYGNAAVVWAGDPDWRQTTVGMSLELHLWLEHEANRRHITRSEMLRMMVIEAWARSFD